MAGRRARSGAGIAATLFTAALASASACNHAWDALEPSSSATSAGSGGHPGGTGGASSTTTSSGVTTTGTGGVTATSSSGVTTTGTGGGSTTTTSSGTGGGGATPCGGTNLLSWDFAATQPDVFSADPQAKVFGGKGVITLPSGSGLEADFTTLRLYDLTGDHVYLEVTQVPNQAQGAYAGLVLEYDSGDYMFLGVSGGQLQCGFSQNGNTSIPMMAPYDPVAHRYWQLRESQGTLYCETAPDGTTWSPAGSYDIAASELAPPSGVRVSISATTPSSASAPGIFQFDDLNGGLPPTGVWCPALSYTDTFPASGPVPGPAWDRSFTSDSSDAYDQMGGTLNLHFGADSNSSVGYESSVAYDMTAQRVSIQAIELPSSTQGTVFLDVGDDENTDVYWAMQSDGFSCQYDANGSNPTIWQGQAPALPAWVGLRESGGAVYCEIYENGAWKSYGSIGGTMDPTRVDVTIGTYEDSGTMPGMYTAVLGNYNLAPP